MNSLLITPQGFEILSKKLDEILLHVQQNSTTDTDGTIGKWITEKDARLLTGRSTTTLWKWRNSGKIEWTKIGNRVFYSKESILAWLEANKKEAFQNPEQ